VFNWLGCRRSASGRKTIMTWVRIFFRTRYGRKCTGTSGFMLRRSFYRLFGFAFATGGRRGRVDFATYLG